MLAVILCAALCCCHAPLEEGTSESRPPTLSETEFPALKISASAGDLAAIDNWIDYQSWHHREFSVEERLHWMTIGAERGSEFAVRLLIQHYMFRRQCGDASKWLSVYVEKHGEHAASSSSWAVERICGESDMKNRHAAKGA